MKVLVVFGGGYPNGGPMTKRLHLYCKGLMNCGFYIKVVIQKRTERKKIQKNRVLKGSYEAVQYEYLSKGTERSQNFVLRKVDDFLASIRICVYLIRNQNSYNTIFMIDIRDFSRFLVVLLAKLLDKKLFIEINEHPRILTSPINNYLDKLLLYRAINGVIAITEPLKDLLNKMGIPNNKILVVPIICEINRPLDLYVNDLLVNQKFIFHSGSLTERKDGLLGMFKAFSIVSNVYKGDLHFYLTGNLQNTKEHRIVNKFIQENGLRSKVSFLGYIDEQALHYYQRNCVTTIINKESNIQNKYCFPTKLGEYLAFGKPVILTDIGGYDKVFENMKTAFIVEPGRPDLIASKILYILQNESESAAVGFQGRVFANLHFNYLNQAIRIKEFFSSSSF